MLSSSTASSAAPACLVRSRLVGSSTAPTTIAGSSGFEGPLVPPTAVVAEPAVVVLAPTPVVPGAPLVVADAALVVAPPAVVGAASVAGTAFLSLLQAARTSVPAMNGASRRQRRERWGELFTV